ncbi:type 4a pilus biogenesis protein PilO [Actinoplanes sp. NPDC026670]|uniref:type 4a pilus biogenesis protein PilO n=1 Tax=Actinoplanes sp. NPDC026670 TaxID=3154700 RepID=UPI0033E323E7
MTTRRVDQIWLFGGLTLVVLFVVGGWFMMVKPLYNQRDSVQADTAETQTQLITEQKRLTVLKNELKKISQYKADLITAQQALPPHNTTNKIPEFLKQLQTLGLKYDVEVSGYAASGEEPSATTPSVTELPITLNIEGEVDNIVKLVKHLQTEQPRALLIETAKLTDAGQESKLQLTLSAFITATETVDVKS